MTRAVIAAPGGRVFLGEYEFTDKPRKARDFGTIRKALGFIRQNARYLERFEAVELDDRPPTEAEAWDDLLADIRSVVLRRLK